jgi:hypothetical protein
MPGRVREEPQRQAHTLQPRGCARRLVCHPVGALGLHLHERLTRAEKHVAIRLGLGQYHLAEHMAISFNAPALWLAFRPKPSHRTFDCL